MRESPEHAALVELFRHHPELAAMLAQQFGEVALPAGCRARVGDPAQKPAALTPDVVIELRDAADVVVMTIIVEIQRSIDEEKLQTWPAYLWLERLRWRSDCIVLVIATRKEVAAWAKRPIHGGPGSVTQVMVVGPDDVPRITDLATARANPALAVLSAGIHGGASDGFPVTRAGVLALYSLQTAETRQYSHLVFRSLDEHTIRKILEDVMQEYQEQDEEDDGVDPMAGWNAFLEPFLVRAQATAEAKAAAQARAQVLLRYLGLRGFAVEDEVRARVLACSDTAQLDVWLDRVLTAATVDDVFTG